MGNFLNVAIVEDDINASNKLVSFFDEFKKQRVQALKEYAKYYGPLTLDTATTQMDYWKWINDPWPWQEGGC